MTDTSTIPVPEVGGMFMSVVIKALDNAIVLNFSPTHINTELEIRRNRRYTYLAETDETKRVSE